MNSLTKLLFFVLLILNVRAGEIEENDFINRFKQVEDKLLTDELFRPLGHAFYLDFGATINSEVLDLVDEADTVTDLTSATNFLNKYDKTEHILRINARLGTPLPSFTAWGWKVVPDLRLVDANLTGTFGIGTEPITLELLAELVTDPGLKQAILSLGSVPPSGTNIGQYTPLQNSLANIIGASAASALMTELAKENIYVPADNVPNLNLYLKAQAKSGLEINLSKDKWFGHFSLYGLYRADYYKLISSDALVNDKDIIDINDNSRIYLASDLSMGYVWKNYRFSMSFDDLAFAELSDNLTATNGNDLYYDPDPLFRFQASGKYKLSIFHIMPYLGLHKRSGYDLSDGWYFGGNLEGRLWKDRLRSNLRLGMDSEHFTIAPGFRLWFLQLDGNLKLPVSNEVDGKKVSTLYSLALRFMIEV
ncbi:MAG: hypothetical protein H6622_09115 [Halobacteriovoraceae bacterium]|nr:hypothetical protein [Halobacteriovoraceae bacterium]